MFGNCCCQRRRLQLNVHNRPLSLCYCIYRDKNPPLIHKSCLELASASLQDGRQNISRQCSVVQQSLHAALSQAIAAPMQHAAAGLSHALRQHQGSHGRLAMMGCLSQGAMQQTARQACLIQV